MDGLAKLGEYEELERRMIKSLSDQGVLSPQALSIWRELVANRGALRLTAEIADGVKELSSYLPLEVRRVARVS